MYYFLDTSKDTNKTPEKELNEMNKEIIGKKGESLLEAISSDDDIAMDSEDSEQVL